MWQTITRRALKAYLALRAHQSFSSRISQLCTLRCFYGWAVDEQYLPTSPVQFPSPARPAPVPRALPRQAIRQLVAHLRASEGRTAQRDAALIYTLLYAGLRAKEAAALCWPAVDLESHVLTVYLSKMNHGRAVQIHPALGAALASWRVLQALGDDAPVFSLTTRPLTGTSVGQIVARVTEAAGTRCTAHVLRHSFATMAYQCSGDIYAVSKALGHKQLKQTEIYVTAAAVETASAVAHLPAPDAW